MDRKEEALAAYKRVAKMLHQAVTDCGWDSQRQFALTSGVPFSQETCRRVFIGEPPGDGNFDLFTISTIARFLGMDRGEIRSLIKEQRRAQWRGNQT